MSERDYIRKHRFVFDITKDVRDPDAHIRQQRRSAMAYLLNKLDVLSYRGSVQFVIRECRHSTAERRILEILVIGRTHDKR
jgi:hypothetical protein